MARNSAPNPPRQGVPIIDPETGFFTEAGLTLFQQLWRQVVAGFVIVPCQASGTNAITLTPYLHQEGGQNYGFGMAWAFEAAATSTGDVTMAVEPYGAFLKAYKTDGAAQATTGDVVSGSLYLAIYNDSLDSSAGGFVLK